MAVGGKKLIDVHTHVYLPRLVEFMKQRKQVPRISEGEDGKYRLIILPNEDQAETTAKGRPMGEEYYDIDWRLKWMDRHGIDHSIISLANPWLDWVPAAEAATLARDLNNDLSELCQANPGKLSGFAVLPLHCDIADIEAEIERMQKLPGIKGYVLGTQGRGAGLDDPALRPVWAKLEAAGLVGFLHPHYGIGTEQFGTLPNGHVMPLALGFPFETTVAMTRLILAGTFDAFPDLKFLIAHAGGTLPYLAGRIDSCMLHDYTIRHRLKHKPSEYLKRFYYDAVIYSPESLAEAVRVVGADKIMFGTDCPFFPPLDNDPNGVWESVSWNTEAIAKVECPEILAENASRVFDISI